MIRKALKNRIERKMTLIFFLTALFSSTGVWGDTQVDRDIQGDTLWDRSGSPYIVREGRVINVRNGTLTIQPGVIVKFQAGAGLVINIGGSLLAEGTPDDRIVFTSARSDCGGDPDPCRPSWGGIVFKSAMESLLTRMRYCLVEYGGGGAPSANIIVGDTRGAHPTLENCIIQKSSGVGVYLDGDSLSRPDYGKIENCTIRDNRTFALSLGARSRMRNVTGLNSNDKGIEHRGGAISGGMEASELFPNFNLPYFITGALSVRGTTGNPTILTIEPGVQLKFYPEASLKIDQHGALSAIGTPESRIVFTSARETPRRGDWKGIWFAWHMASSLTELTYCTVEYGGSTMLIGSPFETPVNTNIAIGEPSIGYATVELTLQNCLIRESSGWGIYLAKVSSLRATCSEIINNSTGAINANWSVNSGINYCSLAGNPIGVRNSSSEPDRVVDARYCWWGHPSGPSGLGKGVGSEVSDGVDFLPWLTRWDPDNCGEAGVDCDATIRPEDEPS